MAKRVSQIPLFRPVRVHRVNWVAELEKIVQEIFFWGG